MSSELILSPKAATQSYASLILLGFELGNGAWNEVEFMHVAEAPVSKSYENVLPPALTVTFGLTFSPLRSVIWLKRFMKVALEMAHKFTIICGMTLSCKIFEHFALQVDTVIEFIQPGSTQFKNSACHFGTKTSWSTFLVEKQLHPL